MERLSAVFDSDILRVKVVYPWKRKKHEKLWTFPLISSVAAYVLKLKKKWRYRNNRRQLLSVSRDASPTTTSYWKNYGWCFYTIRCTHSDTKTVTVSIVKCYHFWKYEDDSKYDHQSFICISMIETAYEKIVIKLLSCTVCIYYVITWYKVTQWSEHIIAY